MKVKIVLVLALTFGAMFGLTSPAFADGSELDGKWTGIILTPDGGEVTLNFTFKVDGSKLTRAVSNAQGETEIQEGKVYPDEFAFSTDFSGIKVLFNGKLHDHVCDLNMDYQGMKFATTLKKVPDK